MPELSRFFGIRIAMFFNEHNPPHFHAIYEGKKAVFNIRTLAMTEGHLPPRVRGFIVEWASSASAGVAESVGNYSRGPHARKDCSA